MADTIEQAWDYYYHKEYVKSIECCQSILAIDPGKVEPQCLVARCYYRQGNTAEAEKWGTLLLQNYPQTAAVHELKGFILSEQKNLDAALREYNQAIQLDPKYVYAYNNRGNVYKAKGDLDAALREYNQAIQLDPKYVYAYNNRGNVYYDKGDLDAALREYNQAIQLDPKDVYAYFNRGIVYKAKGDLDAALREYNQAIQLDPKYVYAYNNRGVVYYDKGDLDAALREYNQAIQLDPKYVYAYNNRGNVYKAKGDLDAALRDCNKTLEIDPNNEFALTQKLRISEGKGDSNAILALNARLQTDVPITWTSDDEKSQFWNEQINLHYKNHMKSLLVAAGDKPVSTWHVSLSWGKKRSHGAIYNGSSSIIYEGSYGAGYLVLTEQFIHIVNLGEVSKKFIKGTNIFAKAFFLAFQNIDFTKVEKNDRVFSFGQQDIVSITLNDHVITMVTASEEWQITPYFSDDEMVMFTGLNAARTGRLPSILSSGQPKESVDKKAPASDKTGQEDIVAKIAGLKTLLESGAITTDEFETKKRNYFPGCRHSW
ncbi:MAG: hypothetical protein C0391_09620 [Anaerolinea sp.]|nr:hypothetical protein [Anaerolinea sp.]